MGQEIVSIIWFIKKLMCIYQTELETELSPSQKSEVAFQLHSAIQAVIFCIRTYLKGVTNIDKRVKADLDEMSAWCEKLLDHPDLPMDTKNNCAMLIVMQSKLVSSNTFISWIRSDESSSAKKLSLIFGIVNTLTAENFDLFVLAEVAVILGNIYQQSSVEPSLMLSICRTLMQLTKKIASYGITENTTELEKVTTCALAVGFWNLEHHLDSIRHLSRETLNNVALLSENLDDDILSCKIFEEISAIPQMNMKALVVIAISQSVSTEKILEKLKELPKSLLESLCDNKVSNHNIANCFETLAMKVFNEKKNAGLDSCFDQFFSPVFGALHESVAGSERRTSLEDLLKRFLKRDKRIFEKALNHSDKWDIEVIMLCLSAGKKSGYFDGVESTASHWKDKIKFSDIKKAMIKSDDSVRNSALMLVAESRKITDGFTLQEFDCIMHFLRYNINVQSPSARQAILGMIKSIFVRINAVLQLLTKKKSETKKEKELLKINKNLRFYKEFLVNLHDFCLDNLFEGANFTRRTLSLRLMFYNTEVIQKYFPEQAAGVWDQKKFDVLMNVLNDSFEANKEMTIEIMKFIPRSVIQQFCKITLQQLKTMVTSIKPPDSLTATYLMEIYVKFIFKFEDFPKVMPGASPESFLMLRWCENLLLEGLAVADKSLIVASSTNPLYGLVQCISRLLSKLDLKTLVDCQLWRDYFERLLVLCRWLTLAVAPVVNNSSPEGILPVEEIEGVDEATREEWNEIAEQTTPQIILLCSWRTIKEVSLLLGSICLRVPLMNDKEAGLISVNQMLDIGDHFLELLSKTKHRGAFEQCFFGFSQLCLRLWTCHESELHKLPSEMLHQMISSISGHEKENNELLSMKNLCATRRSAGLPFMIQALITSELKVSTNKNFHFVMKSLVKFCKEGEHLETRTHSLNILRALFRCSDLNVEIGEYIAEGMKCAILGYGADSWIERNSSTLLFSALMVRIFGVQRTKDSEDLSVKNRMTGRIFFLRYPELYDFVMQQLEEAANYVNAIQMNAKLHPLLLLLIRLYPSALEGNATKLELTGFLPVVTRCSGCVEMQTRILCAKFIANVMPPELITKRISDSTTLINCTPDMPANVKHGILLQILYLTKTLKWSSFGTETDLLTLMATVHSARLQVINQVVCLATFFDIIIEFTAKLWPLSKENSNDIYGILKSCCALLPESPQLFGTPLLEKRLFLMELVQCLLDEKKTFSSSLPALVRTKILHADYNYAVGMQDEYEIDTKAILFMRENCLRKAMRLMPDKELKAVLVSATSDDSYLLRVMAYDALSLTTYEKGDRNVAGIKSLIESAMSAPDQLRKSLLKYANVCIAVEECFEEIDFKFLLEISADASYFVK